MKVQQILKTSTATAALGLAMAAQAAYAQDADDTTAAPSGEVIIVTGSLIQNPNLERSAPVNVTTEEELEYQQVNVAEDLLRDTPGLVANIGSSVNNGNGGASYTDLRGLGSNRNLVLLNGDRLVPSNSVGRVDLNNIPIAIVERVDVLTGGASTTYGADAVTGVVNFITKRDFAGVELQVSESITELGDGNYLRADLTLGANFDDGRGNAVLSLGYQEADPVYQGDRPISAFAIDSFSGGSGGSSTTTPSAFSVPGQGNLQINPTTGALGPLTAFNFAPFNIFQTPFSRFNIFGQARYEVSDAVEFYTRGMFSKNTVNTIIAASGAFGSSVQIPVSNPFLPVAARNTFCANNDTDPNTPGVQTLTPAQCAAAAAATDPSDPNYREITTNLRRRSVEVGPRISEYVTTFFDYKAGLRGPLTDTIDWDIYGAYGESENRQTLQNYAALSRIRDGLLATNPNTCLSGNATCVPLNVFGPTGSITPEMAASVRVPSFSLNLTTLAQARGTLSGDFGVALPSAVDPISFATGVEFREYGAKQTSDSLASTAGELGGAGGAQPEIDGGYKVWEGLAEIVIPLIQDGFVNDFTLDGGVRYSDYKVDAPGSPSYDTWTYKVGATIEPFDGLAFRGSYARAARAPNIGELFTPLTVGLTNLSADPCAGTNPVGNANLTAVCIAQGAPAGTIGTIPVPTAGQANATFGGNLNLRPEKADTYTFGVVLRPAMIPNFSATVDYYNIKVNDAIAGALPGDAIAACFGDSSGSGVTGASATDPACTVIGRDPGTGELNSDPATTTGLFLPLSNAGRLETDGIDWALNWRTDVGFADLLLAHSGNYTFHSKFQASPTSLNRECAGFYSVNCSFTGSLQPEWQTSTRVTLEFEDAALSLLWRHIDSMNQEPDDIANGNGPAFQGVLPAGSLPGFTGNLDFQHIDAYDYFDLSARFDVTENFRFLFTVQNLFDRDAPLIGSSIGSTTFNSGNTFPATYDTLGRRYSATATLTF